MSLYRIQDLNLGFQFYFLRIPSFSPFHTHTHTQCLSLSLPLSVSPFHTHTHTHTSLSFTPSLCLSLSLTLSYSSGFFKTDLPLCASAKNTTEKNVIYLKARLFYFLCSYPPTNIFFLSLNSCKTSVSDSSDLRSPFSQ